MKDLRAIAIHLPQFHPIQENNQWWGKGFTEWTNVVKATSLFEGHYQPHLPSDLGFYDLRLEETRLAQEELAKQHGIYGFCYYHYWFNGKRLLHEPLDRKLLNPKENLPFMLCWANENWTRRWDGLDSEILIKQEYGEDDDCAHIQFLCKTMFSDPRYIRVNNKPFIIIYRPTLFPDMNKTITVWRNEARQLGIGEIYIGFMNSFGQQYTRSEYDIDVAIEFAPHFRPPAAREFGNKLNSLFHRIQESNRVPNSIKKNLEYLSTKSNSYKNYPFNTNYVYDYQKLVDAQSNKKIPEHTYPSLFPMWDNSPRKKGKNALIYINSTPKLYEKWLQAIVKKFEPLSSEENFVFINAWNEWGEGNHLEPSNQWGLEYLEATKRVFSPL